MNDDELTPQPGAPPEAHGGPQEQISVLMELIGGLAGKVTALTRRVHALETTDTDDEDGPSDQPAPWVVFSPPAAAEDREHALNGYTPEWTLENFVVWFNATYLGLPGSPAVPIPECWHEHPGLAMEVATLAYSWRRANLGATANVRDAQYWHHTWRPGFATRLATWIHPHCTDGRHRPVGAPARLTRFAPATTTQGESVKTQSGKEEPS